jgi:hypothetical protein
MPRGGDRGGRKPKQWKHSMEPRKCIQIPMELSEQIMKLAKLLDQDDPDLIELLSKK